MTTFRLVPAVESDVPVILELIKALAEYENMADHVAATEADLRAAVFGPRPAAEVIVGYAGDQPAGFAMYFQTFSTFTGKPGLYLEDIFVKPEWRRLGLGTLLLARLARICGRSRLRADGVVGPRLERDGAASVSRGGRACDERMDGLPPQRRRSSPAGGSRRLNSSSIV